MAFQGPWNLVLLVAIGLATMVSAEPSDGRPGATGGTLEIRRPARAPAQAAAIGAQGGLRVDSRSGIAYTRELRLGDRHFHLRARAPLPRTAARRRFLGVQFELRF